MLKINELARLYLGIQGENGVRSITVDVSAWINLYPNGSVTVWHKRCGDSTPSATGAEYDSDTQTVTWDITSVDTFVAGIGEAEFRLIENEVIKKTTKVMTGVSPAVTLAGTTLGSDWASYINAVDSLRAGAVMAQEAAEDAQDAAEDAQEAAEDAQEAAEDAQVASEAAQEAAEDAQEAAEDAADRAEAAADRAEAAAAKTIPAGGTTGQVLKKQSGDDYDVDWETEPYYTKPAGGVPASDMASAVQTSLGKADTAYQKPGSGIPSTDLASGVLTSIIDDTAGDGDTGKTWSADKLTSDVLSAIKQTDDKLYAYKPLDVFGLETGWRLNADTGLCYSDAGYQLVKHKVTAGQSIRVVSDDKFQFQTYYSVPSSGAGYRVGDTYGVGTFDVVVPQTATYLIISTPTTSEASASLKKFVFSAESEDIGKALSPKSVQNNVVTEWQYVDSGIQTEQIHVSFATENAGYININGEIKGDSTVMYKHTNAFTLKSGDSITINVKGYYQSGTVLSILAKVVSNGYQNLVASVSSSLEEYTYTATENCTAVISYDNRYDHTAVIVRKVDANRTFSHYVKRVNDVVYIKSHYNDTEDIVIEIAKAGGNNLPNPQKIYTVSKNGRALDDSLTASRYLLNRYTDWFSPHYVAATSNIDGTNPTTQIFTGGNHQSNNSSTGGVATAECTQFDVYCDGILIESGNAVYGNSVMINITNKICGYNTWKSDGTGRKILKEQIRITMAETARMNCEIVHTALEAINRARYYGLQTVDDYFTTGVQYLGGANRGLYAINADNNCGNKTCRDGRFLTANGDIMLTHVDDIDLGSFAHCVNSDSSYFTTTAQKSYFAIIYYTSSALSMAEGDQTCVRGFYDWVFSKPEVTT